MAGTDYALIIWRKSSFSGANASDCVEVGPTTDAVRVRDTKNRDGGTLILTPATWRALTAAVRSSC